MTSAVLRDLPVSSTEYVRVMIGVPNCVPGLSDTSVTLTVTSMSAAYLVGNDWNGVGLQGPYELRANRRTYVRESLTRH